MILFIISPPIMGRRCALGHVALVATVLAVFFPVRNHLRVDRPTPDGQSDLGGGDHISSVRTCFQFGTKTSAHKAYKPVQDIRKGVGARGGTRRGCAEHIAQEVHRDVEPALLDA